MVKKQLTAAAGEKIVGGRTEREREREREREVWIDRGERLVVITMSRS